MLKIELKQIKQITKKNVNSNMKKTKTKYYGITIFFLIFTTILGLNYFTIPVDSFDNDLPISSNTKKRSVTTEPFIYTLNGKKYFAEFITKEKVESMKKQIKFMDSDKNSYQIINGMGTGAVPLTEEVLEKTIGQIMILNVIKDSSDPVDSAVPSDFSSEIYFPPVRSQGSQGSCTSWASVYYSMGYLEAKDNGWDASSGNNAYLLSPAWSYNKLTDEGSGTNHIETGLLLEEWGAATWATIPYTDTDYTNWGDESAWREAPLHRPLQFNWLSYLGDPTITTIKNLIEGGTPVTFNIDAGEYSPGLDDNYILSSAEYSSSTITHAQCIVGFDDSITEDGDVGAFRVVNSWGDWWGDGGFYWLTYETLKEIGVLGNGYIQIGCYDDRIDYHPSLVATWQFSSTPTRMDDIITLEVGPHDTPLNTITPHYEIDETNLFPGFMALDISEFQPYYDSNNNVFFNLEIGSSITPGTISSFRVERYVAGILEEITPESPNVPKTTPGYVSCTFMNLEHDLIVNLEVPTDPTINNNYIINATVINNGINDEFDVDLFLYLDNVLVDSIPISYLPVGASETINYLWTPTEYGTYNFTAYAPPIPGESLIQDNIATELITISTLRNYTMVPGYTYTWIDASGGTELLLTDDGYSTVSLPFEFQFYNETFSTIYLGANGYLSFVDSSPSDYSNDPIPSSDLDNYYLIAPFWDDLYPPSGGHIYVQSFGTYWVAEWLDIYHIMGPLVGSFEVVLYETGEIVFNYDYLDATGYGYTCGLNLGVDTDYYNSYQGLNDLIEDFSIQFTTTTVNTAPDAPTNPVPSDEATGVSTNPTLSVDVFDPDGDTMDVYFYDNSDTLIDVDIGVSSGGTASVSWLGLSGNTYYEWYAIADDGMYNTTSATWSFNTEEEFQELNYALKWNFNFGGTSNSRGFKVYPDLNGDGFDDILVFIRLEGDSFYDLYALNHDGTLIWSKSEFYPRYITYDSANIRSLGDMSWYYLFYDENEDGTMDIIGHFSNESMGILDGKTGKTLWVGEPYGSQNFPIALLEDFTGDGKPEIVMRKGTYDFGVLNSGDKTMIWTNTYPGVLNCGPHINPIPDVSGDGVWDIVTGANYRDEIECWSGADGSKIWTSIDIGFDSWEEAVCPDQNSDGYFDILVTPQNGAPIGDFKLLSGANGQEIWGTGNERSNKITYYIDKNGVGYTTHDHHWGATGHHLKTYYLENGTLIGSRSYSPSRVWFLENPIHDSIFQLIIESDYSFGIYKLGEYESSKQTIDGHWLDSSSYYGNPNNPMYSIILINETHISFFREAPDLADRGSSYSGWLRFNRQELTVWCDVENIGYGYASSFNVSYYLSLDTTITTDDYFLGIDTVSFLGPGEWEGCGWSDMVPTYVPDGTYYVGWIIDSSNDIIELNENNNKYCITSALLTVVFNDPTWDTPPSDQTVEVGDPFSYDVDASDPFGIDYYWIDDETNFNIDGNGLITNAVALSVGDYTLEIRAYDHYGHYCTATITITVEDTTSPTWDTLPSDQTVEVGDQFSYDVDASDLSGIDYYWIDDETNFNINAGSGLITNALALSEGVYWLEVRAYDPSDNYCTATIKITVEDTTAPTWVFPPDDQVIELGDSLSYGVDASDLSGISYYWINDTTNFNINAGSGLITNALALSEGVYWLEVRVYDPSDNYCTATIKITVEDTTNPTWDQTPTDQFIEYGDFLNYDVNASDLSDIDDWWLNDTTYFIINDANGVITNIGQVPIGVYWLEVRAYDPFGYYCTADIKITVEDTTDPTWDVMPTDRDLEFGDALNYDLDASDLSGIDDWWLNDTTYFTINDANGVITNIGQVPVGAYWLEVRAYDPYGYYCTADIKITVEDTTDPTWDVTPTDQIVEFGEALSYDINASDLSGITLYSINDTSNFNIDSNGIITNIGALEVGDYIVEIRAYDPFGNYCTATIKITVVDTTNPTWDLTPPDQIIEFLEALSYDINASDLSGITLYRINDTSNFNIDSNGVLTNTTILIPGTYWLELQASDPYGNYCSEIIKIIVEAPEELPDTIPPGIHGYNIIFLISTISIISLLVIRKQIRKKL